ncbi:DNA-binding protein [Bathymodiolus platifrons methanotrophic gill symbiont]|uniref:DNA-binding protein n=1 Tax=Bathymodiolus platifrons methanotrophic gill symbiont TaxID=113268 RepID=UPI001C8D8E01|nr:DNA-binding protein [Bathymodiolus platifrons methanotrophic gill symbiont]
MERKSKVTQAAVNAACDQLQADNKNVTVNAVISITGGSFSTVGSMVKAWKEEQATCRKQGVSATLAMTLVFEGKLPKFSL